MENLISWILAIGAGIVGLLCWLWFSAERDLSKKRRESEDTQSEKQKLADEIASLKQSLSDKEARLAEAANQNQEVSSQQTRLQSDIAELRRKFDESQRKIVELRDAKHTLVGLQARGGGDPSELARMNERIAGLEQELAGDQAKLSELDRLRERLAEGERIRQALREENRRHQDQLAHWRQRIVESEESEKRLTLIQEQFGELLTMQAALAESQRRFQDALVGFTRLMDTPTKAYLQTVTFEQFRSGGDQPLSPRELNTIEEGSLPQPADLLRPTPMAPIQQAPILGDDSLKAAPPIGALARMKSPSLWVPKRGVGVIRAMIVVSVVGIVVVVLLISRFNNSVSTTRGIRVVPTPAIANQAQGPTNSQAPGMVTSDDAVKPQ